MKPTEKGEKDDPPTDPLVFGSMGSGKKSSAKSCWRYLLRASMRFDFVAYEKEREALRELAECEKAQVKPCA